MNPSIAMKQEIKFNEERFKELTLYIADKCSDDPHFGATKFAKILFYADFLSYGLHGQPITGATYFRLPKGPAPKEWLQVREKMKDSGDIVIQLKKRFDYIQKRVIALRQPNLNKFTAEEIALVDNVIEQLCGINATTISELSHMELGWEIASDEEDIPYTTVFLGGEPLTNNEIQHGLELAETYD